MMLGRAWLLAFIFSLSTALLVSRLFHLQVLQGDQYAVDVAQSRIGVQYKPARRGRILDRHGTALVDNRAVYDIAVELAALELTGRARHAVDFWRFDRSRLDNCIADLSSRTLIPPEAIRTELVTTFEAFPAVARRQGAERSEGQPELLAIAQNHFAPDGDSVTAADDQAARFSAAPQEADLALFESGLVFDDAREALDREFELRWGPGCLVLDPAAFEAVVQDIARHWEFPTDMLLAVVEPFTVTISAWHNDSPLSNSDLQPLHWRVLTADRRMQVQTALARFVGSDPDTIHTRIQQTARAATRRRPSAAWFFIPSHTSDQLASLLPENIIPDQIELRGAPSARERIWLIQGDPPNGAGMFSLLCERLAVFLGLEPTELARLIRSHAEEVRITTMQRIYRKHLMVFDREKLQRLTLGLAALYRQTGLPGTVFDIEAGIAHARRMADREWRGSTRFDPIPLSHDIPRQVAVDLEGSGTGLPRLHDPVLTGKWERTGAHLPGLRIISRVGRSYPFPGTASHLIGWLGKISANTDRRTALALGLDPEGWTGTRGIESVYDDFLQGVVGREVRLRTPEGWQPLEHEARDPIAGTDLRLTIDIELQLAVEKSLGQWFTLAEESGALYESGIRRTRAFAAQEINNGRAGMAIIDCNTGAILALASTPGFDLRTIRTSYNDLIDTELSPGLPLHDNAAWAAQPPGSTMKPLVGLAALAEGIYRPGEFISTDGYMARWRGRGILGDHPPIAREWEMEEALQESSNTFFSTLGERLGPERLVSWMQRFGIGRRWAQDVDWQRPGLLPSPGSLYRDRPSDPKWHPSDTWRLAIGQFCTASPLQIATIAATVGNGGTILKPFLWDGMADQAVAEKLDLHPSHLRSIQRGMERVTDSVGTASYLKLSGNAAGIKVAAKTGTSEWGSRSSRAAGTTPDNAWLMGYAPADNPQVAFAIYIHAAGMSGGRACSGVTKRVLELWWDIIQRRTE